MQCSPGAWQMLRRRLVPSEAMAEMRHGMVSVPCIQSCMCMLFPCTQTNDFYTQNCTQQQLLYVCMLASVLIISY